MTNAAAPPRGPRRPTPLRPAALRGARARDAAGGARPDDPGHGAAHDRRPTSAASATSRGSSPPTSSRRRRRPRCGASSATATAASALLRSRWRRSWPPRPLCGAAQDLTQLIVARGVQGLAAGGLMTLAMAAVGDLVAPRERGRYQGYIAATFAGRHRAGPADRRPARRARRAGAGSSTSTCRSALLALAGAARCGCPPPAPRRAAQPLDVARRGAAGRRHERAACSPASGAATATRWGSATILGLLAAAVALAGAASSPGSAARRTRSSRCDLLRTPAVARRQRGAVPGHGVAVRGHRLRAAVPAGGHRRDARPRPACCSSR